jgi:RNA polymerase sigma-70 factor (ECF subfamily)
MMMTGMSLGKSFESVLDAAKLGADWAWAVLYGEIAGPVMGFFRSRGLADPEEAAGDVFFELARGLADFEGTEESFRTFVFAIAYRRLLVENRFSTRRSRTLLADRVLDRLQADVDVIGVVSEPEIPREVVRAFSMLTPEQRDVLSLRIVAGLSVDQVGEVLNRGVKKVKSLQRRGMARVRAQISQVDEGFLV